MSMDSYSELPPMEALTFHTDMTRPDSCPSKYVPEKHVLLPHLLSHHDAENEWFMIEAALENMSLPLGSSHQLQDAILSYNNDQRGVWSFDLLHQVVNHVLSEEARAELLQVTLPRMARLALELPQLLPRPLPLLKSGHGAHLSLSQRQVASLLAHAFFCTYPRRNNPNNQFVNYPSINFNGLFCYHAGRSEEPLVAKLLCIFNYFKRVTSIPPEGVVTFTRRHLDIKLVPTWNSSQTPLNLSGFTIDPRGKIEEQGAHMLQVSFANKKFGGGVLDNGYVQEEIRCITCPEMIVARLFTEFLDHREAFVITGVERYNSYTGYAGTFRFSGDFKDTTPKDESGRRKCAVVAIDALNFSRPVQLPDPNNDVQETEERRANVFFRLIYLIASYCRSFASFFRILGKKKPPAKKLRILETFTQYDSECITRELNKAYVGFRNIDEPGPLTPIASGNWGCGVFKGDPLLKFILQLLAASEAGRDLKYFTFGGIATVKRIETLVQALHRRDLNVGTLYVALSHYHLHGGDLTQYLIRKLNLIPATSVTTAEVPDTPLVIVENHDLVKSTPQANVPPEPHVNTDDQDLVTSDTQANVSPSKPQVSDENQERVETEIQPDEIPSAVEEPKPVEENGILVDNVTNGNLPETGELGPNVIEEITSAEPEQATDILAGNVTNNNLAEDAKVINTDL